MRVLLRQDLRGIEALLSVSRDLRRALGLRRVPDHSILCRFEHRSLTAARLDRMLGRICELAGVKEGAVAVDSTGLEGVTASPCFQRRRGGRREGCVRMSALVAPSGLLTVGAVGSRGLCNDKLEQRALLPKLPARI